MKKVINNNSIIKLKGGMAVPLDNKKRLFYLNGAKHEQGGIDVTPKLEAEGGEVIKVNPKSIKVVTAQKIMGSKSPAELVVNASSTGEQDKVFNKVFKYQENFKDRYNLNDDGTKKTNRKKLNKFYMGGDTDGDTDNPPIYTYPYTEKGIKERGYALRSDYFNNDKNNEHYKRPGYTFDNSYFIDDTWHQPTKKALAMSTPQYKNAYNSKVKEYNEMLLPFFESLKGGEFNDYYEKAISNYNNGKRIDNIDFYTLDDEHNEKFRSLDINYRFDNNIPDYFDKDEVELPKIDNYQELYDSHLRKDFEEPMNYVSSLYNTRRAKRGIERANKYALKQGADDKYTGFHGINSVMIYPGSFFAGKPQGSSYKPQTSTIYIDTNESNNYRDAVSHEAAHTRALYNNSHYIENISEYSPDNPIFSESPYYHNNYSYIKPKYKKWLTSINSEDSHDMELNENYSDLMALRMALYDAGIVDGTKRRYKNKDIKNYLNLDTYTGESAANRYLQYHPNINHVRKALNRVYKLGGEMKGKKKALVGTEQPFIFTPLLERNKPTLTRGKTNKSPFDRTNPMGITIDLLTGKTYYPDPFTYRNSPYSTYNIKSGKTVYDNLLGDVKLNHKKQSTSDKNKKDNERSPLLSPEDLIIGGINLGASIIDLASKHSLPVKSLKYNDPIPFTAIKNKTKININSELQELENTINEYKESINKNTSSSQVALNRLRNINLEKLNRINKLYGNKENKETQLINENNRNLQNIINTNIQQKNAIDQKNLENEIQTINLNRLQRADAITDFVQNIAGTAGNIISNIEQREQFDKNLIAMMMGYENIDAEEKYRLIQELIKRSKKSKKDKKDKKD